jgi:hypothetical protein
MMFVRREHSEENLLFWLEAQQFKEIPTGDKERRNTKAKHIFRQYLKQVRARSCATGVLRSVVVTERRRPLRAERGVRSPAKCGGEEPHSPADPQQ